MNKCLRIILYLKSHDEDLVAYIQRSAKRNRIEGFIQNIDKKSLKIISCGKSDNVDKFMDDVYKGHKEVKPVSVEVEPFLRDKDYRGVFRLIE